MSGTITADRRHISEAAVRPERLSFKNAEGRDGLAGGIISLDDAEGIVTAIVSVTGVEDEVADIIEPGAYAETLTKRNPKVCWAHSWEHPIGKVLHIEELMPGDRRLPRLTRDRKPWPAEAGALLATMEFNLKSDRGREAFSAVEFYSRTGECEYSIGYQVPPGKSTRDRAGVRHIKSLELYELSVVLFGAHPMTGSLSLKEAAKRARMESKSPLGRPGTGVLNGDYTGTVGIERKAAGADGYAPPQGAVDAAKRGLDLRSEHGRGGTSIGIARARDIAGGKNLPLATVKRMKAFFDRHQGDKNADGWGDAAKPSNGYIAWLLWGGDAGRTWAETIVKRAEGAKTLGLEPDTGIDLDALEGKAKRKASDFKPCARCGSTKVSHLAGPDQPRCAECGFHVALKAEAKAADWEPGDDTDDTDGAPDFSDGVMVAVYPDPAAADAIANQIAGPDNTTPREDLHVTLAYLGTTSECTLDADEIAERVEGAIEGMQTLEGEVGGIGMFPDTGNGAPTWTPVDVPGLGLLREAIVEALGDDVRTDHGFTPHMTLGYDIGLITPIQPTPVSISAVRVVYGTQEHDISLGQHAFNEHRDGPGRQAKAAAYDPTLEADNDSEPDEMADLLDGFDDDAWDSLETDADAGALAEAKALTPGGREGDDSPVGTPGGRQNWVDQTGGLPRYIRMVAHGLMKRGKPKGTAIAIAVATMKRWAAGGGKVTPKVQAAAAEALAQWERQRAQAHADNAKAAAYDPALDVLGTTETKGMDTPAPAIAGGGYPYLTGTYEERMAAIRDAVVEALRGEQNDEGRYEWPSVDLRATWDDRLIATRYNWDAPGDSHEDWEMTYRIDDEGCVELGEPQPIRLQVMALAVAEDDDSDEDGDEDGDWDGEEVPYAETLPLADDVLRMIAAIKTSRPATLEGKAGRVLSGRNERRLRAAVTELLSVLGAAGVTIEDPAEPQMATVSPETGGDAIKPIDPDIDGETTSPTAYGRSKATKALIDVTRDSDGNVHLAVDDVDAVLAGLRLDD